MIVPILISVFGFNVAAAKMLSHMAVLGNSCAQVTRHYTRSTRPFSPVTCHLRLLPILLPQCGTTPTPKSMY
jgi:uncharacterized membrane protein YfcA